MVNVIGLGYIGLPTALMLASHGVQVVGTDTNAHLIRSLNDNHTTFKEEGLDEIFQEAVHQGIAFSTVHQRAETYIISVPTPYDPGSKKIDPTYVIAATNDALEVCPNGATIVIESTISPGTIDKHIRPLLRHYPEKRVSLVHAPERIIPGNMIFELEHNNRTIGCDDEIVGKRIKRLYSAFCKGEIVLTDIRSAEMSKVVENTFRDINIAYANELAKICRADDLDVYEIIRIANMHPRVNILSPGPGVGGHCISVDPWFLVGDYPSLTNLISTARETNDSMPDFVLKRASGIMKERDVLDASEVGIYGLTYKENVDDIRESPTLQMITSMEAHLAASTCKVYDPWVPEDVVPNQVHDLDSFLDGLSMVIVMVAHAQFLEEIDRFKGLILLDTRNVCGTGPNIYKL